MTDPISDELETTVEDPRAALSGQLARLSQFELNADERTITTGAGLTVTYRPNLVTPAAAKALGRQMERENRLGACKLLARIVTRWDLVGPVTLLDYDDEADEVIYEEFVAKGEPVPLEPEVMQHVHEAILASIALEVLNDVLPLELMPTTSS